LILTKIIKIVVTRDLRPECIKFDFGCGSAPYPAGGAQLSPDPLSGGVGLAAPPQGHHPHSRPFGPRNLTLRVSMPLFSHIFSQPCMSGIGLWNGAVAI